MQSVYPGGGIKGAEPRVTGGHADCRNPNAASDGVRGQRRSRVEGRGGGNGGAWPARLSIPRAACGNLLLRYNDSCVFFRGADSTSTSYVYSSLVRDDAGRVVGGAAVHAPVADLSAGDVQVADHVPLRRDHLADAVTAALEDRVVVQGPRDRGQRGPLHVAHEGNRLCRAHHFFAKGRNDFGSSVCRKTNVEGSGTYE